RFAHLRRCPTRAVAQQATFEEFDDLLDDQDEDHERRRPREHAVHPEELLFHPELITHADRRAGEFGDEHTRVPSPRLTFHAVSRSGTIAGSVTVRNMSSRPRRGLSDFAISRSSLGTAR